MTEVEREAAGGVDSGPDECHNAGDEGCPQPRTDDGSDGPQGGRQHRADGEAGRHRGNSGF